MTQIEAVTNCTAYGVDAASKAATGHDAAPVVFVVDDDASVRRSLDLLIHAAGWRPETFASAQEFLASPRPSTPSCLVLDVALPDLNGLDLQKQISGDRLDTPVIFITGHGDVPTTVRAMKGGAIEFLTKPFRDQDLLDAVQLALERDLSRIESEKAASGLKSKFETLTPREREIMALVASGLMNKQVAGKVGLSEITVKVHRGRVMQKMGAKTLADLVRIAEALGIRAPAS